MTVSEKFTAIILLHDKQGEEEGNKREPVAYMCPGIAPLALGFWSDLLYGEGFQGAKTQNTLKCSKLQQNWQNILQARPIIIGCMSKHCFTQG